ncbi:multidrug effflux MFS transporter [Nitratireductor mangrovi]|uniref:Bcr/CflA family efflux transporter n=1 Tax=Nitratireductor mangrovi TaxID=2599600 RepID=A0A5B8KUY4_9HYPH|nr:Bcr/CflA family efflux MFS transporter [Nitratireductor mangrovi]QDY99368.2 multidrug effflux MFS transporter [Nitratireductor mangrovi]
MNQRAIVVYCGLLMSISAFTVDITLPSFPAMAADLDAPFEQVQWTITLYMVGAGLGQLLWGSLSDRFGRRLVLGAGLGLFLVGCLSAAFSPSILALLASRLLQGAGAAAAIVCSRAILRDLHAGEELARSLALATAIFAVGPIFAPLIGAGMAAVAGWRFIFLALAIFAAGLLLALLRLPETLSSRSMDAVRPKVFAARTLRLFRHPQSRHFLLLSAVIMSSMLLILAVAPRIYEHAFGLTGTGFALFFALHGMGIVIGQTINRRLIRRVGVVDAMIAGNAVLIISAGLMVTFALAGWMNAYLMTALLVLFATSYLIVYSNAAAMVLDPHGDIAGFTAAFYGFTSQIGASVAVSLLVIGIAASTVAFAAVLIAICGTCLAGLLLWRGRSVG